MNKLPYNWDWIAYMMHDDRKCNMARVRGYPTALRSVIIKLTQIYRIITAICNVLAHVGLGGYLN